MKYKYILIALLVLILSSTASAQSRFDPTMFDKSAKLIETVTLPNKIKAHIVQLGYVDQRKAKVVFWEMPSGVITFGKVFDKNGRELNTLLKEKHGLNKIAVSINAPIGTGQDHKNIVALQGNNKEQVFELLEKLDESSFTGPTESEVYVFYDFQCVYCAEAHKTVESDIGKKVKWLPVSILTETSHLLGANVLDGSIPIESMSTNVKAPKEASPKSVARVWHNTALLEALLGRKNLATPTLVYKNSEGKIKVVAGLPDQKTIKAISES